jgi:hypothetical protein
MNYIKRFTIRFASALTAALVMSGCASSHVLRDFRADGCSFFPDGDAGDPGRWSDCCVNHDAAYWRGGTADERRSADVILRDCVLARTGRQDLADRMYRGVRLSGAPRFPSAFRWGYGWGYGRDYEPLNGDEQQEAEEKLAAYRRAYPGVAVITSTSRPGQTTP